MVLNIRQKQKDAILRMLNFNDAQPGPKRREKQPDSSPYKILILDDFSKSVIAPLISVQELRHKGGVTLHLAITNPREPIPDVPAVYFVRPTADNVELILQDAESGLYDGQFINFTSQIQRPLLEQFAEGAVRRSCAQQVAKVFDQYMAHIALEANIFSLGLPNSYLELNDPSAKDHDIQASLLAVVEGLFGALASMACVPVIRCPKGGAAHHIATQLDQKIRENLKKRNSIFHEGSAGLTLGSSRPLLCLFDRNFELSVMLQHSWTYKPLVHDVFSMHLNKVVLDEQSKGPSLQGQQKKSYEMGDGDFFWEANGRSQFNVVASEVDRQLTQYKQDIAEINAKTGANLNANEDPNEMMQHSTQQLMSAISQLPQLTEKKRTLDKHTTILHRLLEEIKKRHLDKLYNLEELMVQGKSDLSAVEGMLKDPEQLTLDKLRLVLVYLLTTRSQPSDAEFQRLQEAIGSADGDHLAVLRYVRRMRRLNLTGKSTQAAVASEFPSMGQNQLLSWAGNTFGQGLNSLTKGVKNMLTGEQQAAVTVAVEGLMDAKPVPELEQFAYFDPKGPAGKSAPPAGMSYKESIVFVVGGGNYLEAESLMTWATKAVPAKNIVYGATELLNGEQFAKQLSELGKMSL